MADQPVPPPPAGCELLAFTCSLFKLYNTVAEDVRQLLSFVFSCGDANPISQIWWMDEGRFRDFLKEESERSWEGMEDLLERKKAALAGIAAAFGIEPADPYGKVKALQASFDPACLRFSEEYYDTLGLDSPEQEEI